VRVGNLQELHAKYYDQGFRVVAIADEPPDEVQQVMSDKGARYWIGVDTDQTTLQRYAGEGSLPLPQFYLVDVEGVVVSNEMPDETTIEAQLKRVFEPALGRELNEKLASAREDYDRGAAGAAWVAAGKHLESEDEALAADATFLREKVERYAAWQREKIELALSRGQNAEAMGELLVFEVRFDGMEVASWASERIQTLEKDEEIHAERFAWDKLRKALRKEAKGVKSRGARQSAVYAYQKVVKSHPGTVAAKIAEERIQALGGD